MRERTGKPFVTRKQLLRMLKRARLTVSNSSLRRYQALGLLDPPRAYGRVGRGRGVDWGWPPEQAEETIRRVRLIKKHQPGGRKLVQFIAHDPEMSSLLNQLIEEAKDEAYADGLEAGREEARRELKRDAVYEPDTLNHTEEG